MMQKESVSLSFLQNLSHNLISRKCKGIVNVYLTGLFPFGAFQDQM